MALLEYRLLPSGCEKVKSNRPERYCAWEDGAYLLIGNIVDQYLTRAVYDCLLFGEAFNSKLTSCADRILC